MKDPREEDYQDYDEREEVHYSHREQCYYDRADLSQELLERGEIDEERAAEMRVGA